MSEGDNEYREFLYSYRFDGKEWGGSLFARDEAEARLKIKSLAWAQYVGELKARIPASVGAFGLVPRFIVWLRNLFSQRRPQ